MIFGNFILLKKNHCSCWDLVLEYHIDIRVPEVGSSVGEFLLLCKIFVSFERRLHLYFLKGNFYNKIH